MSAEAVQRAIAALNSWTTVDMTRKAAAQLLDSWAGKNDLTAAEKREVLAQYPDKD